MHEADARVEQRVSRGARPSDHGRLCRLKRGACAAVETRTPDVFRQERAYAPLPSLSAGRVEGEQDCAPAVLPHHPELARPPHRLLVT